MARVADHLSVADLERHFRSCPEPVRARHLQVIWLLAQGHTVGATSRVTSFGTRWIEQLLERYNASGPEALGDGHRHNGAKPRLLTPEVLEVVRLRLARTARWVAEYYPVEDVREVDDPPGGLAVALRTGDMAWARRLVASLGGAATVDEPAELAAAVAGATDQPKRPVM